MTSSDSAGVMDCPSLMRISRVHSRSAPTVVILRRGYSRPRTKQEQKMNEIEFALTQALTAVSETNARIVEALKALTKKVLMLEARLEKAEAVLEQRGQPLN